MDEKQELAAVDMNPAEPERYLPKRRRAVLFFLVGIWGIYQFSVREDFNPLWIIPAAVLVIVSAYNFSIANQKIRKHEQEIDLE
ncbi:MAG: hypothetical protein QGG60_10260 [Anaerolineales bacterium]|jgi:hypothetical protein|nr:hypothetical protein [Pseudomonadales bacterium]MDP7645066.1 hypothetical protein [Anaerolineales bacterium]HJL69797.1 hypothetical protein [Anaerolineales bacterium]HJO33203.1 hypothetical protein [Anaerolineales bacterium]|tara:strand:- start:661 stop:912 length:252 start_codon:yes stop_codon:yes gene_type:complete